MDPILPKSWTSVLTAALGCVTLFGCSSSGVKETPLDGGGTDGLTGVTGVTDGSPQTGAKRIFVTATTYTGNLGGAASADAICTASSDAVGLGGKWTAWISTSTSDALSRIQEVGPWYLLDGTMVFTNKANFRSMPLAPIQIDEHGAVKASNLVWTGTLAGAIHSGSDCQGFTTEDKTVQGTYGVLGTTSSWTSSNSLGSSSRSAISPRPSVSRRSSAS
jgi:hypothetical protein